ncbi:MAG TPA: hypothetical protein VH475_27415 [Tepidisphaeraceae bacterium]|jgi:chromosome segregation ATPase
MKLARNLLWVLPFALAAGCASNEDRSRAEQASQDNVALKAQVTELTQERDSLKKDLNQAKKDRDQYLNQYTSAKKDAEAQSAGAAEANTKLTSVQKELDAARKAQGDTEQLQVRLKAAEDGVTAARAKATDAERAAATAADAANRAKEQAAQLANERTALQQKVDALQAELKKKAVPPDLNK